MSESFEPLLSFPQAWKLLGVSRPTLCRLVDQGELRIVQVSPGRRLIDPADLREFIATKKRRAGAPENDDGPRESEPFVREGADDGRDSLAI